MVNLLSGYPIANIYVMKLVLLATVPLKCNVALARRILSSSANGSIETRATRDGNRSSIHEWHRVFSYSNRASISRTRLATRFILQLPASPIAARASSRVSGVLYLGHLN